jgi:hypothetical protein
MTTTEASSESTNTSEETSEFTSMVEPTSELTQEDTPPPGGTDPNVPPIPQVPGNIVVPGDDGEFLEFGPDGTPLGQWRWDPDNNDWFYEELPPLADALPLTAGRTISNGLPIGFMCLLIGIGSSRNPRRRRVPRG